MRYKIISTLFIMSILLFCSCATKEVIKESKSSIQIGVYYFDGWSGINRYASAPNETWAKNAPTHLTKKMVNEFPGREPIWGWRNDSLHIMEQQIDLAAEHGIDFFLFCWYWKDDKGPINLRRIAELPEHTSLNLYMKAKNRHKIKFGLLVANHYGGEIVGLNNWERATEYWMQYFKDPQHVTVEEKPLIVIFDTKGINTEELLLMQNVAKKNGFSGLSIAGCGNLTSKDFTHRTHYNIVPGYDAGSEEHNYSELVEAHKSQWSGTTEQPYIPQITVGWDKRPWEGQDGLNQKEGWYFPNQTPAQFKQFLQDGISWMDNNPNKTTKERIMLIYAWNELGEGGYLVPTKDNPKGSYLKVIKETISSN